MNKKRTYKPQAESPGLNASEDLSYKKQKQEADEENKYIPDRLDYFLRIIHFTNRPDTQI